MPTGSGLVARARQHIGERYVNIQVPKDKADYKGPWDCAEFASWLVYQEGGTLYGCTENSAKPSLAEAYTGAWKRDSNQIGKRISVEEAATIPGAFLLRYPPGEGKMGHIAVSDGEGGTIEAKGASFGVVADKVAGRRWDTGVLIPGIDYQQGSEAKLPPVPRLYAIGAPNMDPGVVAAIQTALTASGFSPGPVDGVFGPATQEAVARFQRIIGIVADGEVGPDTAAKLGVDIAGLIPPIALGLGVTINPLVGLAIGLVPALARLLQQDRTGSVAKSVHDVVERETGTADPASARRKIEGDPDMARALQQQIEGIATGGSGGAASPPVPPAPAAPPPVAPPPPPPRTAEVIAAETDSTNFAREFALKVAKQSGPLSQGPLAISILVLLGFYATLIFFLWPGNAVNMEETNRQVIYLIIGALTSAFATVISFWLGSSQGSRFKDATGMSAQFDRASETDRLLKEQAKTFEAARQTAIELAKPAAQPAETDKPGVSNFEACLARVLKNEGETFSDHPEDKGGPTRFGITLRTLREWRSRTGVLAASVTREDVRNLEPDEVREIYRTRYWNEMNCEQLPRGVDLAVFDFGVNAGPGTSAKMLQNIVGAEADGSIGPATIAATRVMEPGAIVEEMAKRRLAYYRKLDGWGTFGNGWSRRNDEIRQVALAMVR